MARPTLPRALVVDRSTPIQQGGEATAELFMLATGKISDAVDEISRHADEMDGSIAISITALASYIGDLNNMFMSYFDPCGDQILLLELAHTIYPRTGAETVLHHALSMAKATEAARDDDRGGLESTNPGAAKAIAAVRKKAQMLADTILSESGPARVLLEQAVLVYDIAQADPQEQTLYHLGDAESFVLGALALVQQDCHDMVGGESVKQIVLQLRDEAVELSRSFDCGGRFYSGPAPVKSIAASTGKREEVAA